LTVGFDSNPWSIYVADQTSDQSGDKYISSSNTEMYLTNISKIDMQVGDAVLYRGHEKVHWREKFEGKWQAQIFLHYVDASGKHAEWIYDKKQKLAHHSVKVEDDAIYWAYEDGLSLDSCAKLIESCESQLETQKAFIGDKQINLNVRDVNKIILPAYRGIGATLAGMALNANVQNWHFDVDYANQTEYLKYDENGHYVSHIDTFLRPNVISKEPTRKLTTLAFLNDNFEGGRLYLQIGHERIYPPQKAGTVIVFPSFILHGVEPVTKGIRRSVVTWLVGPWFK
jgi:PKHD-type hydroxylase